MAPTRTQLHNLVQKKTESFKEYAQRWREVAAKVQPPMVEREMVEMFTDTLDGPYYASCSLTSTFADMVMFGERVEMGIKLGKIQDVGVDKRSEEHTSELQSR